MVIYFAYRHLGATGRLTQQDTNVDTWIAHAARAKIHPGNTVVGTLSILLAAALSVGKICCEHVATKIPLAKHGQQPNVSELHEFSASLTEFSVHQHTFEDVPGAE